MPGLLSILFLGRRLGGYQWTGLAVVVGGLLLVGVSSMLAGTQAVGAPNPMLGNLLILLAQLVVAIQMVLEEHYLSKYQVPPLLVVGWQGVFGLVLSIIFLTVAYYIPGQL